MKLTYEEFQKLPMTYIFGLNRDDLCARKYVNQQWRICKEVVTKRKVAGDIYSGFEKPLVSYYRGNDGDIFDNSRDMYEAEFLTPWFEGVLPAHDGWYETDRGMLYFQTVLWFHDDKNPSPVAPPKLWRGMRDLEVVA